MNWLKRLFYFLKRWYYNVPNFMQVDVQFSFAKVYNVDKKIDVAKGQRFHLFTDLAGEIKWFSDNDPVLKITALDNDAVVVAEELGISTILITETDFGIIKQLVITVVEDIDQTAVALEVKAGQPIIK